MSSERRPSGSKAGPSKKHRKRADEKLADSVLNSTSLNRLKSTIRQTKRFLAKDELEPVVRIENERKLEALENQLGRAEQSKKERKNATRYHGVKFVERKKILRRIGQAKVAMEAASDKAGKKTAQQDLKEARIDLHYVLTFPNDRKYISLYPEGTYAPHETTEDTDETSAERARVRKDVRKQMKRGELSAEPEVELEQRSEALVAESVAESSKSKKRKRAEPSSAPAKRPKPSKAAPDADLPIEADDFFETD